MKEISVVAAIIEHNEKILCVQRGKNKYKYISMKFEFPGGKIEQGETLEGAIIREIKEELNMIIKAEYPFMTVKHQYPDFLLTMHAFMCSCKNPSLTLSEHINYKWLEADELRDLDWAEADIPIMEKLINGVKPI